MVDTGGGLEVDVTAAGGRGRGAVVVAGVVVVGAAVVVGSAVEAVVGAGAARVEVGAFVVDAGPSVHPEAMAVSAPAINTAAGRASTQHDRSRAVGTVRKLRERSRIHLAWSQHLFEATTAHVIFFRARR